MTSTGNVNQQYLEEEKHYWKRLRQELENYKRELRATNVELTEGLGISRQSLVSFMKNRSPGLPIGRSNLMQLWNFLTNPERLEDKKLSEQERLKREQLREDGPNQLLQRAGFLPSNCYQASNLEPCLLTEDDKTVRNWSKDLDKQLDDWFKRNSIDPSHNHREKLKSALVRICGSGRSEFIDTEIYRLSESILKNNELLENTLNQTLNLEVIDCEFKTLSFSIEDLMANSYHSIKDEVIQARKKVRRQVENYFNFSNNSFPESRNEDFSSKPVIEVSVKSKATRSPLYLSDSPIIWTFISNDTHYENMFIAVAQGMGYASHLELTQSFSETIGRKDYSLVEASIELNCSYNQCNYSGKWVDRSTILTVLQSTVIAARNWLSNYLENKSNCEKYMELCQKVSETEKKLLDHKKSLNGYHFESKLKNKLNEIIQIINEDRNDNREEFEKQNPHVYDLYKTCLARQYCSANLMLARLANVQGNLKPSEDPKSSPKSSQEYLQEIEKTLEDDNISEHKPTKILFEVERRLYQFFSGNREFLLERSQWLSQQEDWLAELKEYVKSGNPKYGNNPCSFDLKSYTCISEIFGRIGRLDLCFGKTSLELKNAIDNLLMATYCSSMIGHKKRVVHWLINASRVYCRLGENEKAEQLADLSDAILESAIAGIYGNSGGYQEAVTAEINLAKGERYLLIEENYKEAVECFLKSLKGSIYLGFARLISESMYGIARAGKHLKADSEQGAIDLKELKKLHLKQDNPQKNPIAEKTIEFLTKLDCNQSWDIVAEKFKEQAITIWNDWYQQTHPGEGGKRGKHPIGEMMESEEFLKIV